MVTVEVYLQLLLTGMEMTGHNIVILVVTKIYFMRFLQIILAVEHSQAHLDVRTIPGQMRIMEPAG